MMGLSNVCLIFNTTISVPIRLHWEYELGDDESGQNVRHIIVSTILILGLYKVL